MALLDGRVAVVTGGGRGIGRAICRDLAARGAAVVVNDLGVATDGTGSDGGPAHEVAEEIRSAGGQATVNSDDITEPETGAALVRGAVESFGRLDVLVNVAGILRDRMIFNLDPTDWDAVIRVHLRGTYSTVRAAASHWRELRDSEAQNRIINFTSVSGLHGAAGQPNYAAAKMGIVGLTYSLANSLGRYGVTANAISPGAATRMTTAADGSGMPADFSPEQVATVVSYLASRRSGWLTGRVIHAAGSQVRLYNNPEPIAEVHSDGPWQLDDLGDQIESTFRPLADGPPASPYVTTN